MGAMLLAACGSSPTAPSQPPTPTIPNVAGQWTGQYTINSCTESGSAIGSGYCQSLQSLGGGGAHTFTPTQTGSTLSGPLGFGGMGFTIPVTGTVGTDAVVTLTGSGPLEEVFILTVTEWRGMVVGNSLTGTMTFNVATGSPIGAALISASFALQR